MRGCTHLMNTQNEAIIGLVFALASTSYAAAGTIPSTTGVPLTVEQITSRLHQTEDQKRTNLQEYSVTRKYVLHNPHMKQDAEMLVRVSYRKGTGKTFQVLEAKGVEGMSKRVFQNLIDGEKEGSHKENVDRSRLNERNYDFELLGTEIEGGRRCYVLALHPKSKTKYLVNGKAWIDAEDFALVKIEGHPAANLSFWAGKPYVVQTWQKCGDFWMAAENRSMAQSMLIGSTELTVRNSDYEFGGSSGNPIALGQGHAVKPGPQ
jgi:hypothetical protein